MADKKKRAQEEPEVKEVQEVIEEQEVKNAQQERDAKDLDILLKGAKDRQPEEETAQERAQREAKEKKLLDKVGEELARRDASEKKIKRAAELYSQFVSALEKSFLTVGAAINKAALMELEHSLLGIAELLEHRDEFNAFIDANIDALCEISDKGPEAIDGLKPYLFQAWRELQQMPEFQEHFKDFTLLDLLTPEPAAETKTGKDGKPIYLFSNINLNLFGSDSEETEPEEKTTGVPPFKPLVEMAIQLKQEAEEAGEDTAAEETLKELEEVIDDILSDNQLAALPNDDSTMFLMRLFNAKAGRLPTSSKNNRHEKITRKQNEKADKLSITKINTSSKSEITIEISQASELMRTTGKGFAKMLTFVMQVMTEQNFSRDVGFPLRRLVDLGMYSNTTNARRAFRDFFEKQSNTVISGSVKSGRKIVKESGGILFYHYDITNGYVTLKVNENFNMEFIASYFTVFPKFAYSLNVNAFSLVRYIFFLARQNTAKIAETGFFTIKLEAVREFLGLPAVEDVKGSGRKYRQQIITPIEEALEEIESKIQEVPEAKGLNFTITPINTDTSDINEYLNGYLEIGIKGEFAQKFIELAEKTEKKRIRWERAKLKAEADAVVKAEQKEAGNKND